MSLLFAVVMSTLIWLPFVGASPNPPPPPTIVLTEGEVQAGFIELRYYKHTLSNDWYYNMKTTANLTAHKRYDQEFCNEDADMIRFWLNYDEKYTNGVIDTWEPTVKDWGTIRQSNMNMPNRFMPGCFALFFDDHESWVLIDVTDYGTIYWDDESRVVR